MKNLTLLIAFFITVSVNAQWTTDTDVNTLVATSEGGDMQAVGTTDGQTYVVFWKTVSAPVNYELRLQLLDANGERQFGDDGMLISDNIPMGTYTVLWSVVVDSDDNLYVGVTGSADESGRAFKLDTSGIQLWGADGVAISGSAYKVTILPLESGEAVVSWIEGSETLMQKYDAVGNSIWAAPQALVSGSGKTAPDNFHELSDGGFILVFHTYNYGISSTLNAQRYDSEGVSQWATPVVLSNTLTVFNTTYSSAKDADTVYLGYKGTHSNRFDSYLQRINPDGTLPWGINGVDFDVNETNYEMDTEIAFAPESSYIWAICTYTDPNQTQKGEYVQKFNKVTGARELSENAKVIYNISNDSKVHASGLHLVDDQPFFLLQIGFDNGASPTTLSVLLLDSNGDFVWPEEVKPMATYNASKSRCQLTKPANGQSVAVFIEDKSDGAKIYAQNFVQETASPAQPILMSPVDGAIDISIDTTFSWDVAQNAETYSLQIAEDEAFTTLIADESGIAYTSFDFTLPNYLTTYYWRVMASNTNGDSDWSEVWNFTTVLNVGVNAASQIEGIMVYPNPASEQIMVNAESTIDRVEIFNAAGQLVKNVMSGSNTLQLKVSDLETGIYFIMISTQDGAITKKLVIE